MKHGHFTLKQKKKKEPYICTMCLRDKNDTKKFSFETACYHLLCQIEEMLIARVFPVMSVYTKPGGQRAYRGHCINFPQEVQQLFYTLPRQPKELPVIIVTVDGKNDMSKDLIVRREKSIVCLTLAGDSQSCLQRRTD